MNRQNICVNFKTIGCEGVISEKGKIYCEKCVLEMKTQNKNKRDSEIYNLESTSDKYREQIFLLEKTIKTLQQEIVEKNADISSLQYEKKQLAKDMELKLIQQEKLCSDKIGVLKLDYEKELSLNRETTTKNFTNIIDTLKEKHYVLEKENHQLKYDKEILQKQTEKFLKEKETDNLDLHIENEKLSNDYDKLHTYVEYLEKENAHMIKQIESNSDQYLKLTKTVQKYETTHCQVVLDNQKSILEIANLNITISKLLEELEILKKENSLLTLKFNKKYNISFNKINE